GRLGSFGRLGGNPAFVAAIAAAWLVALGCLTAAFVRPGTRLLPAFVPVQDDSASAPNATYGSFWTRRKAAHDSWADDEHDGDETGDRPGDDWTEAGESDAAEGPDAGGAEMPAVRVLPRPKVRYRDRDGDGDLGDRQ
ncbi:MAG: hypothetical protein HOQ24_03950, partial [Mycobacteriaceae bacterium]|nr:hypothetical protein [Mycobacteriaceae bacterium]